jgi:hypothetical protein
MESDFKSSQTDTPGRITLDDPIRKSLMKGKCMSFFEWIVAKLITKYRHASKLYTTKDQKLSVSHIKPGPIDAEFTMKDYLYSNTYRIKIEALIPEEQIPKLIVAYGPDWLKVVNNMYGEIERDLYDDTVEKFAIYSSDLPLKELFKIALYSLIPFGLGNKQFHENDFTKMHRQITDQFYAYGDPQFLICSEFVALTMNATLIKLNTQLQTELSEKGQIVRTPFDKDENLHKMLPGRLLHVLKKAGCVEKEKKVPVVSRFFKGKPNRKKATTSEVDELPILNTHITQ